MNNIDTLNIFYEEPASDRWFKFDRYPRKLIRRVVRGKQRPGGVMMVALELMHGLRKLNIPYRFNDYSYIKKHPKEIACIIGKPQVLNKFPWKNPIMFGAGVFSHPIDNLDLLTKYSTIRKILVPGPWMKDVFSSYYGNEKVVYWPVGIDTDKWNENIKLAPLTIDFLIYDKVLWNYGKTNDEIISPILAELTKRGLSYELIRYGKYVHSELMDRLSRCKYAIFLCEHETQGIAYQQILATGTPILAWDQQGYWQDPAYYPHKVKFHPVSSVPYWAERCGCKFRNEVEFPIILDNFLEKTARLEFSPRTYILENLTLERCAMKYVEIYQKVKAEL